MRCQTCIPVFTATPELKHHGKETCSACGRFIRWVPKPQNVERQQQNGQKLVALRNTDGLSQWEREFVDSLDGQGPKISPKQQAKLDEVAKRHDC